MEIESPEIPGALQRLARPLRYRGSPSKSGPHALLFAMTYAAALPNKRTIVLMITRFRNDSPFYVAGDPRVSVSGDHLAPQRTERRGLSTGPR